jgi:hypothetical protein
MSVSACAMSASARASMRARTVTCVVMLAAVSGIALPPRVSGQDRAATNGGGADVIDELVAANRVLANEGIVDGLGHVSR